MSDVENSTSPEERSGESPLIRKRSRRRNRNYCFTINNPTIDDCTLLESFEDAGKRSEAQTRYIVFQVELGVNEETPHVQGYIEFVVPKDRTVARRMVGGRAHVEARRGTRTEARRYCMKEDTRICGPFEFGIWVADAQGGADCLLQCAKRDLSWLDTADLFPSALARYPGFFDRAKRELMKTAARAQYRSRNFPKVYVLVGPPGSGKTSYVYLKHKVEEIWTWAGSGRGTIYFDDYCGEKVGLFDDYGKGQLPWNLALIIFDIYPKRLNCKYGHVYPVFEYIYITSNREPEEWYPDHSERDFKAMTRRITQVLRFPNLLLNPMKFK